MLIQAIGGSLDTDWWWFLTKRNWREALEKQRQFDQSTLERGGTVNVSSCQGSATRSATSQPTSS